MAKKSYFVYRDSITGKIQKRLTGQLSQKFIMDKIKNIPVERFMRGPVSEAKKQMLTFVTTAFSLTAALFWNDAIKAMIISYIPREGGWPYLMLAAVIVTAIAITATWIMSRTAEQR